MRMDGGVKNYTHKNGRKRKTQFKTLFSLRLKKLCEIVKNDVQANNCDDRSCSTSISSSEIEQCLKKNFSFLREKSKTKKEVSQSATRHVRDGNCLTVYSNLDVAPVQKPFRKTSTEEMSVYLKNIVETDPSLKHLLTYGSISINPVCDWMDDEYNDKADKPYYYNRKISDTIVEIDTSYCGVYRKLLEMTEMANKASSSKPTIEDLKLDVAKMFPIVFSSPRNKKANSSSVRRSKCIISNRSDELEYNSDSCEIINPSDVLEVCIQEDAGLLHDNSYGMSRKVGISSWKHTQFNSTGIENDFSKARHKENYRKFPTLANSDDISRVLSEIYSRTPADVNSTAVENDALKMRVQKNDRKLHTLANSSEISRILAKFSQAPTQDNSTVSEKGLQNDDYKYRIEGLSKIKTTEARRMQRHTVRNSIKFSDTSKDQYKTAVNLFSNRNAALNPSRKSVVKNTPGSQNIHKYAYRKPKYLPLTRKYMCNTLSQRYSNRIIKDRVRKAVNILSGRHIFRK